MRGFLSIDFEEGDQSSYKGIDIRIGNKRKRFDSGNITVDFINYIKWAPDGVSFACSSSWDHFFMDGDQIVPLHIDHENGNKIVTDIYDPRMDHSMEYPVPAHVTNFEELRAYYRTHK